MKLTQNDTYKVALEITGCNGIEWPFYSSKIVECNNLELLHSILTCGMPNQFLSPWHHEKRTQEFISKISMVETNLEVNDGYLIKSPATEYLDASEKSVNSYYLGLIFTKLLQTFSKRLKKTKPTLVCSLLKIQVAVQCPMFTIC